MIPVCATCERYITRANREHPGYCSPTCRDADTTRHGQHRARARLQRAHDADYLRARLTPVTRPTVSPATMRDHAGGN